MGGRTAPVAWNNLSGNTTIVGTSFRARFSDVYSTRQTLLNKIAVTLGVGAVDTINIAPGAATEIIVGTLDTANYNGAWGSTVPGSLTVTPSVNCLMTVSVTGTISATNSTGITRKVIADASLFIGGGGGDQKRFARNIVAGEEWVSSITCTKTISATAGTNYVCGMDYSDWTNATIHTNLTDIQTRVELVKR
jgi:hypothetical protein